MIGRRYNTPSSSALVAFESAARHCNFSRAAEELHTSQSAISRHIAGLEGRLGAALFLRAGRGLTLTAAGEAFYRAVVAGLEGIEEAARSIAATADGEVLTIACSHEISHLYLMPRFEALQNALGPSVRLRVMTADYEALDRDPDQRIDLLFGYQAGQECGSDQAVMFREAVTPVASPAFAEEHKACLSGPVESWGALPFLQLTKENRGWATWEDWFRRAGRPERPLRGPSFDNYVYLLEAAAAGRGLALGWRGLIERYLEAGSLVTPREGFVECDRSLVARLTRQGRQRGLARRCLDLLNS